MSHASGDVKEMMGLFAIKTLQSQNTKNELRKSMHHKK